MNTAGLLFPHQLFEQNQLLNQVDSVILVEEFLFFRQYKFHQQKLVYHRATMQYYAAFLRNKGIKVEYINAHDEEADIRVLVEKLSIKGVKTLTYYDVCDNWLEKRLCESTQKFNLKLVELDSPLFLNTKEDLKIYFAGKKKFHQTDFYIQQRKKLKILVDENNNAIGGKWTFDAENRLKYPKGKRPPQVAFPEANQFYKEAIQYVEKHFKDNYGSINEAFIFPHTHEQAKTWLQEFLAERFHEFGAYEDAIVSEASILHHSVLTPMLNIGLLTPQYLVHTTLAFAKENNIPLNSLEGFIRQIIGWREFIRGVYVYAGIQERTRNFWNFKRKIPSSFWEAQTGILPIDKSIQKLLATAYTHHIERLMVLSNFMLLCTFDPDEVYRWFMEMYIDAYDWVMVPNVYGMAQFADGGLMSTKPYISGSAYILKMSNYAKGDWCLIWDALFWRFMHVHRAFFLNNPRLGMLVKTYDKMPEEKRELLLKTANEYLAKLTTDAHTH